MGKKSSLDWDFNAFTSIIGKKREQKGEDFVKMEEKAEIELRIVFKCYMN